jgi:biopolymer transport protein TolR
VKVDKTTLVASVALHVLVLGWGLVSFSSRALPQTQAKSLDQEKTPLQLSVDVQGKVFINNTEVAMNELIPKLKAIADARGSMDERIFVRADKKADYGTVARIMGQLSGAGFKRLALVTEVEQGS